LEPTKEELLFGKIALHNKLITADQYKQALEMRRKVEDVNRDFGRLVKSKGFLDDKQYRSVRRAQEKALVSKGHPPQAAKYLARGMNADGSAPGAEPEPVDEPEPMDEPEEFGPGELGEEPGGFGDDDFGPGELGEDDFEPAEASFEPEPEPEPERAPAQAKGKKHKRPADPAARKTMLALLKKAREAGASDLHMSCGAKPFLRLHGQIHFLNMPKITPKQGKLYAAAMVRDQEWNEFWERNDWDGSVALDDDSIGRFRANLLRQRHGVSAVYRVINTKIPTLDQLGLPQDFERFTTFHQGLVLVTGAAGSGKSSTLASLLELVNKNRKDHIITMEDPIEYVFEGKSCNVTQRQIDVHTRSWGNALRASLREDPDVIMIGEMRDLDTVQLAITAAETGHLVYGTLHTTSATRTIDRLLDVFPPGEQSQIRAMVSESLKGIISQMLLPTSDGKGRVCAYEVLVWTPAVANLIREGTTYKLTSVLQTGKKLGMVMMDESLRRLWKDGKISKEVARANATNPKLFQ
jgi:twitching motility protein PilT